MTTRTLTLLAVAASLVLAGPLTADDKKEEKKDAPVSGTFTGNGKEAKLAFASSAKSDFGEGNVMLIFTETDHSKEKDPRTAAAFNRCGSALIVTITPKGKIVGCEVCHEAHKKSGFTDLGTLEAKDFKTADGMLTGTLTTNGEAKTFGEKWEVKLTFAVKQP
jgi:hypothetical protein